MSSLLRTVWDRASLYLPVLLMGVLALATYWLVRSTPVFDPPDAPKPPTHNPDYFMKTFSVKTFDTAGKLKSQVSGKLARHYPDTDTTEIDAVDIRAFNEKGQLTTATAAQAVSNADGSEVQLIGNATVVREATEGQNQAPRIEFKGEFLHANLNTERVKSHKPVQMKRGADWFSADSMDFDNINQVITLQGRVKGALTPQN
jgi:lipopolysaccharide export system protein LptC